MEETATARGATTLSGDSVGVQTGNTLYVGPFMGDRLLKIDLSGRR